MAVRKQVDDVIRGRRACASIPKRVRSAGQRLRPAGFPGSSGPREGNATARGHWKGAEQLQYAFLPIFLFVACVIALGVGLLLMAGLFNPGRSGRVTRMPYESGMDPIHDTRRRFDVRFHLLAITFLVFDVELLFLFPWAVASQTGTRDGGAAIREQGVAATQGFAFSASQPRVPSPESGITDPVRRHRCRRGRRSGGEPASGVWRCHDVPGPADFGIRLRLAQRRFSVAVAGPGPAAGELAMAIVELPDNVVVTKLDELVSWCRKNSLWPMPFATACCGIELMATGASRHDIARFGAEVFRFSPRQCDLMIVAGRVVMKMLPVLQRIWQQMPEPKWCISMGALRSTGGVFDTYSVVQGIDRFMPVDMYIPGCPPRPEQLIQSIIDLQEKIQREGTIFGREFEAPSRQRPKRGTDRRSSV